MGSTLPQDSSTYSGTSIKLSVGARVGIAVGIVAAVIVGVICFFALSQERKRRVRRPGWQRPRWTQPIQALNRPSSCSRSQSLQEIPGEGLNEAAGREVQELEEIREPRELPAVHSPKELPGQERLQEMQSALQQREVPVHDRYGSAATGSARYM